MEQHSSTTSPTLEALEVLRGARELLMTGCWVNRSPKVRTEQCAITAPTYSKRYAVLTSLASIEMTDAAIHKAAFSLFPERTDDPQWAAPEVNDHPDTTFNDVMSIYDEAERILKDRLALEVSA